VNIQLRTGGLLGQYLPAGSDRNRAQIDVPDGSTPAAIMTLLNIPEEESYLVSVNGKVLTTREAYGATPLHDGDRLAIMPPIRGG